MRPMVLQFITHFTDKLFLLRFSMYGTRRRLPLDSATHERCACQRSRTGSLTPATFVQRLWCDLHHRRHVELVKKIHADGVHLGKKDMPVAEARKMLGKDFIIGGTANTFEDVKMHYEAGADYIGCGPFRFTTTKKNLSPILGLEGYRSIVSQMKEAGIHLPSLPSEA